jgi:hypothetical protein
MTVDAADVPLWILEAINAQWPPESDERPTVTLMTGQTPAADWCSGPDCWTVYARLDTSYPAGNGITQDQAPNGLLSPIVDRWHLGTFMCVADLDDQGNPPSAEQQTTDALHILDTMEKLRCAADAVITGHFSRKSALLGAWFPIGPSGGCAGGYWPLSLSRRGDPDERRSASGIARRSG